MMKSPKYRIVLTQAARDTGVNPAEIEMAALSAIGDQSSNEVWFKAFRARGRQFALCTKVTIEVDYFPGRATAQTLAPPASTRR
ncbi:hypothetical protein [Aestuariivirga litoralis]|uniref:hypothetical protein n=1 Tax=Aestuariivirga litoralis TaxID=2650924 RepID=UPI0011B5244E|nr:hypothetical protein [Aestuariivirga litoralis]